jgi:hypothetical protein
MIVRNYSMMEQAEMAQKRGQAVMVQKMGLGRAVMVQKMGLGQAVMVQKMGLGQAEMLQNFDHPLDYWSAALVEDSCTPALEA